MCLGIPGKVTEIYQTNGVTMGKVDFGGVIKEICLEYLPNIQNGAYVIVHVGFAISQIDEAEAYQTMELLREIDMLADDTPELSQR